MVNQRRFLTLMIILFGILLLAGMSFANPVSKYIGPDGGEIKLKDGSKLIVPEGALGDAEAALSHLRNAETKMRETKSYVSELETQGEEPEIKAYKKDNVCNKINRIIGNINTAIEKTRDEKYEKATEKVSVASKNLDGLDEYVEGLLGDEKISQLVFDNVIGANVLARQELNATISAPNFPLGAEITVDSFHCTVEVGGEEYIVLIYECNPTGLVFNGPVPLEIPFALLEGNIILESDTKTGAIVVLYSQDGLVIDEENIVYGIERDKKIITFYISHFTYYYFPP